MLTSDELLEHIETKHIENDINILLFFNDIGFYVLPLRSPQFIYYNHRILFQANGYNVFSNDFFEMDFTQISDKIGKWLSNPQHLCACEIGYKDQGIIEIAYSRDNEGILRMWKNVVCDFLECANIHTIDELNDSIKKAKERFQKDLRIKNIEYKYNTAEICEQEMFWKKPIVPDTDFLADNIVYSAIKHRYDEIIGFFSNSFQYGIISCELYLGRHPFTNKYVDLQFIITFKDKAILQTPLYYDYTIVSEKDQIPDILYNIAVSIKASIFKVAVGYAYKRGIDLIIPVMRIIKTLDGSVELCVGALQNHNTSKHLSGMDKNTAGYINELIKDGYIDGVSTCDDTFYHGKFYYISNGEISYVLAGSSNITKSAYFDNTEFDMLFRMDLSDSDMREREDSFKEWYENLIRRTTFLSELDVEKFPITVYQSKSNRKNKDDNAIRRLLSDQEEKERLDLILKYSPDEMIELPFKGAGKASFKAFKKYHVFVFVEKNIVLLESFSYGDACYAFSANEFSRIKHIFSYSSKIQLKDSEYYITSIEHDGDYELKINALFSS